MGRDYYKEHNKILSGDKRQLERRVNELTESNNKKDDLIESQNIQIETLENKIKMYQEGTEEIRRSGGSIVGTVTQLFNKENKNKEQCLNPN